VLAHLLPALYAALIWWAGTALVFTLDQLPSRSFRLTMALATLLMLAALACTVTLAETTTSAAAYAGFTCGILIWAWQEIAFLTGLVTGPNRGPLPEGTRGWARFRSATAAVLHHELAILAMGGVLLALLWDAPNQVALHTYLLLWAMRLSAKLNVFLGCRNLGEGMLPAHLSHLASYFRQRRMNALFPISVIGGSVAALLLFQQGLGGADYTVTAWTLLAALMMLAVIEHLFLMLPVALDGLWTWGRPRTAAVPKSIPHTIPLGP
jgi:putative photosynthetic complex assembly protein 2